VIVGNWTPTVTTGLALTLMAILLDFYHGLARHGEAWQGEAGQGMVKGAQKQQLAWGSLFSLPFGHYHQSPFIV
jgi:hypothetical protein